MCIWEKFNYGVCNEEFCFVILLFCFFCFGFYSCEGFELGGVCVFFCEEICDFELKVWDDIESNVVVGGVYDWVYDWWWCCVGGVGVWLGE